MAGRIDVAQHVDGILSRLGVDGPTRQAVGGHIGIAQNAGKVPAFMDQLTKQIAAKRPRAASGTPMEAGK